ncbi:lytic transglycosylase domain-containing protein [Caulobacter hibisci]|uniref:Lytic transglycosylase domain-containing protein n=1 Tax=Caulobacter hibisci TaxID=2035993 RepID=A0ABS0SRU6_9CAUL|nr:lytic transglycosylase domain-containing protein [Caulobacter hibisci]MBI1682317.1 lytic transglycosylase domain-containing protein [Caulobacter hibisci]
MTFDFARQAVSLAALAICCLLAAPAAAQVLEIGDEGEVTRFEGPAVFTDGAVETIAPPKAAVVETLASEDVRRELHAAAADYALDPKLVEAVAWRESRFRPAARSRRGAMGVMQLMPGTARDLGVDPADMAQNIKGGAMYLRQMLNRFGGDVKLALAAYNAGPGAVLKHGGVPPYAETQAYVASILGRMAVAGPALALPALGAPN